MKAWHSLQLSLSALLIAATSVNAAPLPVDYDILYVRAPRYGDQTNTQWPEVKSPLRMEPGSDLMLLRKDGTEEVLVNARGEGAVLDPVMSFDAKWVYYAYIADATKQGRNYQRDDAPTSGADIYKLNLATREVIRLTQQTWAPPTGATKWAKDHLKTNDPTETTLGYGIFNMAPCPLPGGRIMFLSSRDGYLPNKTYTFPNMRLYVMDEDGRNIEQVGFLNIGSAMHPTILKDGRVMFSTYESQGLRDARAWSLWAIEPDGRYWEPLMSSFKVGQSLHWQTQLSDGRISVIEYYNLNNNGFGTLLAFKPETSETVAKFGSPIIADVSNAKVKYSRWWLPGNTQSHLQFINTSFRFSPKQLVNLTAFAHGDDNAAGPTGASATQQDYAGKVTQPAAAPNNDVIVVYSPGPANGLNRPVAVPRVDGGIYIIKGGVAVDSADQMVKIKNDPAYNEMFPRPVVPYKAIYGVDEPAKIAWLPNDGREHPALPAGTPFGLIGASSFYHRESLPGAGEYQAFAPSYKGLDKFNTSENDENPNFSNQGSDTSSYTNDEIVAVRIVGQEPVAHRSYGPTDNQANFYNHAMQLDGGSRRPPHNAERLRILGEIPLRKKTAQGQTVLDPTGAPDTSFLAKIPADTPFTFQTIDKRGMALNIAQTWHQVRPGEIRVDCGGCHAHSKAPIDFFQTAASKSDYVIEDLAKRTPLIAKNASDVITRYLPKRVMSVEYYRDIKPIIERNCAVSCHRKSDARVDGSHPDGNLILDDTTIVDGHENTYNRLARDEDARYGYKPMIRNGVWRGHNASRYIRKFQARRSLLMWKLWGERLDGFTNADNPTESQLGNAATLPAGADRNLVDIDYTGSKMPPTDSSFSLTDDEKMLFARWIDLGAPADFVDAKRKAAGYLIDEVKPVLTVASPRPGRNGVLSELRFGAYDNLSGLDAASLSVKASVPMDGQAAGTDLASRFTLEANSDGVWVLKLTTPITQLASVNTPALLTVRVKDLQGNEQVIERAFSVSPNHDLDPKGDPDNDGMPTGVEEAEGLNPQVKDNDVVNNARWFVMQLYRDLFKRQADEFGLVAWTNEINKIAASPSAARARTVNIFLNSGEFDALAAPIVRLYYGSFLRNAERAGLEYWIDEYRNRRRTALAIAEEFVRSAEFRQRYGANISDSQFVDLLYTNIFERTADVAGKTFWEGKLRSGELTRGALLSKFTESAEFRVRRSAEVTTVLLYTAMLKRDATNTEFAQSIAAIKTAQNPLAEIERVLQLAEYRSRFMP